MRSGRGQRGGDLAARTDGMPAVQPWPPARPAGALSPVRPLDVGGVEQLGAGHPDMVEPGGVLGFAGEHHRHALVQLRGRLVQRPVRP